MPDALPWRLAWQRALFGDPSDAYAHGSDTTRADGTRNPENPGPASVAGFYRGAGPAAHFRTAAHAAPVELALALRRLCAERGRLTVIDLGAGRGELVAALHAVAPGLQLHAVDLVDRPTGLPAPIHWWRNWRDIPSTAWPGALVMAWELLDTVPCEVFEWDDCDWHRVLVDHGGREALAEPAQGADREWLTAWWPGSVEAERPEPGDRAESGLARDRFWGELVQHAVATVAEADAQPPDPAENGDVLLLAVDYQHERELRPPMGSLAGYRAGRLVPPVPDGACDITAHVALDAVAAAGEAAGAVTEQLITQREALWQLGIRARPRPGRALTAADLARLGREAELIDPAGLGGFGWLLQRVSGSG